MKIWWKNDFQPNGNLVLMVVEQANQVSLALAIVTSFA